MLKMTRGVDVTRILFFWITCFQAKGQKETLIVRIHFWRAAIIVGILDALHSCRLVHACADDKRDHSSRDRIVRYNSRFSIVSCGDFIILKVDRCGWHFAQRRQRKSFGDAPLRLKNCDFPLSKRNQLFGF
jgi:hypothetical protein